MAQRNQVIDVVVIFSTDHDIDHRIKNGAFFHGWFGSGGLNIVFNFFRHFLQAVHISDLLADFILIIFDAPVGIDFLGIQVRHDLNRSFAEDIAFEDIRKAGLRINRKYQHFIALFGQPIGGGGAEGGFSQAAFAAKHQVAPVREIFQRSHRSDIPGSWS